MNLRGKKTFSTIHSAPAPIPKVQKILMNYSINSKSPNSYLNTVYVRYEWDSRYSSSWDKISPSYETTCPLLLPLFCSLFLIVMININIYYNLFFVFILYGLSPTPLLEWKQLLNKDFCLLCSLMYLKGLEYYIAHWRHLLNVYL